MKNSLECSWPCSSTHEAQSSKPRCGSTGGSIGKGLCELAEEVVEPSDVTDAEADVFEESADAPNCECFRWPTSSVPSDA